MKIVFRIHALQRMALRRISAEEIRTVISTGETIEDYPDDRPYPSRLLLGFVAGRALHVVTAYNAVADETIVITAYDPDPQHWEPDFRRRRP
ncbi:MAG: DUF4258 domain-containing protein [Planctomycetes bacterium]|nr:DUF4258 domain-containing protein [Planctomycetota bacterium]